MNLLKIKKAFFRKDTIGKYLSRKTFRVLNKFGGLVRKTAQRSMRVRKKGVAPKGQPPFAHGKKLLRKLLFYSLNDSKDTVVVGPLLLQKTAKLGVPKLLEQGGTISQSVKGKTVTRRYHGNPYMIPAFNIFIPQVASWYKAV